MTDFETIQRRQGQMESDRTNFETMWQDVGDLMLPRQAEFQGMNQTAGMRRTERIYDEEAMLSLNDGIAAFEGYVIPRGQRWQRFEPRDQELLANQRVRAWYELKTNQLFALRSAPLSGFETQVHESIASLMAFGNQGIWPELLRDARGMPMGIYYRSEHLASLYVLENAYGRVDTIHRKFQLDARQALQKWGDKAPECARKAVRDNKALEKHDYLHVIQPRADYEPGRLDHRGKPIASCYVSLKDKQVFDEGGYRTMPLIFSRYEKAPSEVYGRGPAMNVLPAVKASQQMMRDLVTATEFMARPALAAIDDLLDQTINYAPGEVTYGAIDEAGNRLLQPLFEGIDINGPKLLLEETRAVIRRAFFIDLFRVREEQKTHLLNADVMEQLSEKGILLSPLARQETEWFDPMAAREVDLMADMGLLDDMPPEVAEAGGVYQMRYENPLKRAQKSEAAAGYYRTLEGLTPIFQVKPEALDVFMTRYPIDKVIAGLAYINGIPADWEATDEERAEIEQSRAQQANAAALLQAAPVVSKVARDLSGIPGGADGLAA